MILLARKIASRRMMLGRHETRVLVRALQILASHGFAHQVDDGLDRNAAGNLTSVVAAHAVGEHEQTNIGIDGDGVLVVLADLPGIAHRHAAQLALQVTHAGRLTGPVPAASGCSCARLWPSPCPPESDRRRASASRD